MKNIKNIVILGYCIINIISFCIIIETQNYGNTLNNIVLGINEYELLYMFLLSLSSYVIFVFFKNPNYYEHYSYVGISVDGVFIFILVYNVFVFYGLGIGKAGTSSASIGFLQNILPIFQCTLVYYAIVRSKIDKIQAIILILACLFILLKGWSSHIFILMIAEILYKYRNEKITFSKKIVLVIMLPVFIVVFFYIYKLKYYFRSGMFFDITFFNYFEYVISRLAQISNIAYLYEIKDKFNDIISTNGNDVFFFIREFILSIVPKSIIGIDDYRPLDNLFGINFINPSLDSAGFAITTPGLLIIASTFGLPSLILCFLFIIFITFSLYKIFSRNYGASGAALALSVLLYFNYSGSLKEIALIYFSHYVFKCATCINYNLKVLLKRS
ncbi:oligosaccharide repeat unit polymerase [Citrobacter werkmanii]|uniref:oligosaccharide repeat unit polymerase n=1 Tax=Citrobacter freundii complex TaxID=1344959 RepID=UPI00254AF80D|nr:oligosaccharide repeat unit polymerase [Citrobacter werkmanii]